MQLTAYGHAHLPCFLCKTSSKLSLHVKSGDLKELRHCCSFAPDNVQSERVWYTAPFDLTWNYPIISDDEVDAFRVCPYLRVMQITESDRI